MNSIQVQPTPAEQSRLAKALGSLGYLTIDTLTDLGRMGFFLFFALIGLFKRPFRFQEVLKQLRFIGAGSITVIFFTALATGMVLGLQGYSALNRFGADGMLGTVVALSLIMEMGPILTAISVAGRAGSAMCAELGIMRISEQIDALDCMAIDPFRYLISPKFLAMIISVPLLTAVFDVVGIFGGYVVGVELMGANSGSFMAGMAHSVTNADIRMGFIKSLFFGLLVAWICTGRGFFVHMNRGMGFGAESVSRATTQAVVFSSISVLISDYFLTSVLL